MKIKVLTVLVYVLVGLNLNVLADGDEGGDQGGDQQGDQQDQGDNEQGGNIDGSETLIADIVLTPTNNAPATATGQAKLESDNENGAVTATLTIETQGLDAGD